MSRDKWHKSSERKPAHRQSVWMWFTGDEKEDADGAIGLGSGRYEESFWDKRDLDPGDTDTGQFLEGSDDVGVSPTYWMPLRGPKPPKPSRRDLAPLKRAASGAGCVIAALAALGGFAVLAAMAAL
jgi:hypothetical protein